MEVSHDKNIDRVGVVNTVTVDVCNQVDKLNELIRCRDATHCLSDNSNDIEKLCSLYARVRDALFHLVFTYL